MNLDLFKAQEPGEDTLALRIIGGDLVVEIDCPWDGDTEHGFGNAASFTLTPMQARDLGNALLIAAGAKGL